MTAATNAAAVLTLLNDALPAPTRAYELDLKKDPSPRPEEYVEMSLSRRAGGERRASGRRWPTGYRITIGAVSAISIANVRTSLQTCRDALEGKRLVVDGQTSTPVEFETQPDPDPEAGSYTGYLAFTYVIRD